MPLTGLANAAIDRVAPDRAGVCRRARALRRGRSRLLSGRGAHGLVERQEAALGRAAAWARRRYDVDFATTSGLMHVAQPPATVERLQPRRRGARRVPAGRAVAAGDDRRLADRRARGCWRRRSRRSRRGMRSPSTIAGSSSNGARTRRPRRRWRTAGATSSPRRSSSNCSISAAGRRAPGRNPADTAGARGEAARRR